ncbi:olfactory receptor 6E1-like [Ciconia boyciana]|uniref:olfactory receptor 6E1-like n=1 Tax=Ciconia boyciana TaxID=52775 RepID=UPI003B9E7B12
MQGVLRNTLVLRQVAVCCQLSETNQTTVVEFIRLGLTSNHFLEIILFAILFVAFLLILLGNIAVITFTLVDQHLYIPMYFFLRNFSLVEICFTSTFVLRTLYSLLTGAKPISLSGCFLQLSLFFILGICTFFHIALMSFDCYVAIHHPLHYATFMSNRFCLHLVLGCWVVSFFLAFSPLTIILCLPFCRPNIINHFYCDTAPLLQLSCTDTGLIEKVMLVTSVLILPGTLSVTAFSYAYIVYIVTHIQSSASRKKAFSTCSAHLIVVAILYSSSIFRYIGLSQQGRRDFDKVVSFLYCVITQLCSPYIYTLQNEKVKQALKDLVARCCRIYRNRWIVI